MLLTKLSYYQLVPNLYMNVLILEVSCTRKPTLKFRISSLWPQYNTPQIPATVVQEHDDTEKAPFQSFLAGTEWTMCPLETKTLLPPNWETHLDN